jgi:hypothetical protein
MKQILGFFAFVTPRLLRLTPISKISQHFATGLSDDTIHILVEVPQADYGAFGTHIPSSMLNGSDDRLPFKRARRDEKLLPSDSRHKLWLLRKQSNTKSFIVQRKLEDTHASLTYWVMTLQDEINELLGLQIGGLSGILITEEYTEAFRAVIEFAETGLGKALRPTDVADDENEGSDQSETGVHDSYFNPFSNRAGLS